MVVEKDLLIHWWHYYGKHMYTLRELEEFNNIIDKYGVDKVLDAAVASYICEDGSPTIVLTSIRNNCVEELFDSLPNIENMGVYGEHYKKVKENFINIISETYKK